jgi:hypothetical protein
VFTPAKKRAAMGAASSIEEGVPPQGTAGDEASLSRTTTRQQLQSLQQKEAERDREIAELKAQIARKQDAPAPDASEDVSVDAGGGSMQAQAQAQASSGAVSGRFHI